MEFRREGQGESREHKNTRRMELIGAGQVGAFRLLQVYDALRNPGTYAGRTKTADHQFGVPSHGLTDLAVLAERDATGQARRLLLVRDYLHDALEGFRNEIDEQERTHGRRVIPGANSFYRYLGNSAGRVGMDLGLEAAEVRRLAVQAADMVPPKDEFTDIYVESVARDWRRGATMRYARRLLGEDV